jgi:tetratricopeptide (TPR) repeat protein
MTIAEAKNLYEQGTEVLETNPSLAIELLTRSLDINPDSPPAIYNRVVALARVGRDREAVSDLEHLERIAPEMGRDLRAQMKVSAEPYTDLARAEYKAGNFELAVKKCDSALAYDPSHGNAWVVKALALKKLGDIASALECFTTALQIDPGNYWACLNRAELHREQGYLQESLLDYSRAIELRPTEPDSFEGRSALHLEMLLPENALADRTNAERLKTMRQGRQTTNYIETLRNLKCRSPSGLVNRDVKAVEESIGTALPAQYRQFLATCGGWWGDLVCACREPTPFGSDHWLSGFHDAAQILGNLSLLAPRNMVTIAYGSFEKFTCISVAGVDRGFVYALDFERRSSWSDEEFHLRFNAMDENIRHYLKLRRNKKLAEKPPGYENIYLLATDFNEFLACCRPG